MDLFDKWYRSMDSRYTWVKDWRVVPFIERMHIHVLKVAMALHVSESDELVLLPKDIEASIQFIEDVLATCSEAFGGHGKALLGQEVHKVLEIVKIHKKISQRKLMSLNYTNTTITDLNEVIDTIRNMDEGIEVTTDNNGVTWLEYKGKEK